MCDNHSFALNAQPTASVITDLLSRDQRDPAHTMFAHCELQELSGRDASRKQSTRPPQFMFIDCDSRKGGINAKPHTMVQSFVMKSARHKKSWSTRPRSPKLDLSAITKLRRRSSSRKTGITEQVHATADASQSECKTSSISWTFSQLSR